jgi:hypothetical protein
MKLFKNFLKIWLIGTLSSLVPFMYVGLVLGIPSVFLASIIVTCIFRKELG